MLYFRLISPLLIFPSNTPSPVADQGNSFSQLVSWELGNTKVRVIIDLLTPSGVIINTNEEGGQQCKI